ncbi:MAG: putative N-formylglutamate amidohydrolase [Halioglobus sp.]|jgi:predicted N-formylglutamate amidohydrolase
MATIITCEHGGARIPPRHQYLYKGKQRELHSHRGWDAGALRLADKLSRDLPAPLFKSTVSRLLVDLNRSLHHPRVFSEFTIGLEAPIKQQIIERYYRPYRDEIENAIRKSINSNSPVMHLSVHSFSPDLNGQTRNADIGLLYDPARTLEKALCDDLRALFSSAWPDAAIRRNYPYRGNADGLTTALRRKFSEHAYVGVELEINQKHVLGNTPLWRTICLEMGNLIQHELACFSPTADTNMLSFQSGKKRL